MSGDDGLLWGLLYYVYAGIVDDMLHARRHARLSSRLQQRQTGEAFSDYPPATGTVPGFDEPFSVQHFLGRSISCCWRPARAVGRYMCDGDASAGGAD